MYLKLNACTIAHDGLTGCLGQKHDKTIGTTASVKVPDFAQFLCTAVHEIFSCLVSF